MQKTETHSSIQTDFGQKTRLENKPDVIQYLPIEYCIMHADVFQPLPAMISKLSIA